VGRRQDDVIGDDGAAADVLVVHFAADDSLQKGSIFLCLETGFNCCFVLLSVLKQV
jgi:hypothetical protein